MNDYWEKPATKGDVERLEDALRNLSAALVRVEEDAEKARNHRIDIHPKIDGIQRRCGWIVVMAVAALVILIAK